jgi:hypothetical protein
MSEPEIVDSGHIDPERYDEWFLGVLQDIPVEDVQKTESDSSSEDIRLKILENSGGYCWGYTFRVYLRQANTH